MPGLAWQSTGTPGEAGLGARGKEGSPEELPHLGFGCQEPGPPPTPLQCGTPPPAPFSPSSSGAFLLPACPRPWMDPSSLQPRASSHAKFGTLSPPTLCPRVTRSLMGGHRGAPEPPASCPTRTRAGGERGRGSWWGFQEPRAQSSCACVPATPSNASVLLGEACFPPAIPFPAY